MKNRLSVLGIATLAVFSAVSAHASPVLSVNFTGIVYQTQGATGQAVGSTGTGHFDLDSGIGSFLDFTIAGQSVAAGYVSFASIVPALTDAFYMAQVSPVTSGMPNNTFSLDLSSLSTWPSSDTAYTLLTDRTQLTANLDTINNPLSAFPSTFDYYTANASGANVVALAADLTSITATVVAPEPASIALTAPLLLALGFFARRRMRLAL